MASNPDAAAIANSTERAEQVLRAIAHLRDQDFTGVGVVFYEGLAHLPHLQLTDSTVKADPRQFAEVTGSSLTCLSSFLRPFRLTLPKDFAALGPV
jgi:hypothetical protein